MLGIENLKKVAKVGIDIGEQLHESAKNGLNWRDSFDFIDEGIALVATIGSFDEAEKEFADLDDTERQELYDYISDEFDIDKDKVERVVEDALNVGFSILRLIASIKAAKEPPAQTEEN